jgi:hypothetical protein
VVAPDLSGFQAVIKNRWPDGSAKYAILSGRADLTAGVPRHVPLIAGTAEAGLAVLTEADLLARAPLANLSFAGIGVELSALIGHTSTYDSVAHRFTPGKLLTFVAGPEMSSFIYASGVGADPILTAWFEVRLYRSGDIEILPWIENGFLRKDGPASKTGLVTVAIGGTMRFSQHLTIANHTRTPLLSGTTLSYWFGSDPGLTMKHDVGYLSRTRLVPSYLANNAHNAQLLASLASSFTPFGQANYHTTMGTAGYHPSIGLIPEWDVAYLTTQADPRAYRAVMINGYAAGRYGIHFRDEKTYRPIRFSSYPHLVVDGRSSAIMNDGSSSIGQYTPTASGEMPAVYASSHHPSMGFMAYLLTGRFYFMEQMQFLATLNFLKQNDTTRQYTQGILETSAGANTTRGAAWAIRSLAQAAALTPDDDPLKSELVSSINANILYYYGRYVAQQSNPQGVCEPYEDYTDGDRVFRHAAWMEDFLTAAFGYLMDLGVVDTTNEVKATAFFNWKAQAIIGRLGPAREPDAFDFRDAAQYTFAAAPGDDGSIDWKHGTGPWYSNWGEIYRASLGAEAGTVRPNHLRNAYFPDASSYWGNLQPAIAYAVTHQVPGAAAAYARMVGTSNWEEFVESCNSNTPVWCVQPYTDSNSGNYPASTPIPSPPPADTPDRTSTLRLDPTTKTTATTATFAFTASAPRSVNSTVPTWVKNLPLWQWYPIPNTALSSIEPSPRPPGWTGPSSKIDAWCGAALKREGSVYLIGAAGGHADYAGNEVNALRLNAENPRWVELRGPTETSQIIDRAQFYLDKRPGADHTYYALQFIESRNRLFLVAAGGMNMEALPPPPTHWPYQGLPGYTPSFNMVTNDWDAPESIARYRGGGDVIAALVVKHPVTEDIYYNRNGGGWWQWVQSMNTWSKLSDHDVGNYAGAAIDPKRNRLLTVGSYSGDRTPDVRDLRGDPLPVTFRGLGAGVLTVDGYPGVIYDETNDRFLVFFNADGVIKTYRVHPETWEIDEPTMSGVPPSARPQGIHNAVQYVPELKGFVIANRYDGNVYFVRTAS